MATITNSKLIEEIDNKKTIRTQNHRGSLLRTTFVLNKNYAKDDQIIACPISMGALITSISLLQYDSTNKTHTDEKIYTYDLYDNNTSENNIRKIIKEGISIRENKTVYESVQEAIDTKAYNNKDIVKYSYIALGIKFAAVVKAETVVRITYIEPSSSTDVYSPMISV